MQVSAALDHNVGTLLVGVVRQIRLSQPENVEKNMSGYDKHEVNTAIVNRLILRRKSKVRGFLNRVRGHESEKRVSKSFENLSVI